ncbi:MAG: TatD family hydrolase [Merismopedia sp. SIO2A8]|nr:TatD family hydrolase [Merismopedia sp. SIO2A8]
MQLIDTHVHLNFPDFQDRLPDIAEQWRSAGVTHLVHSCVEPEEFDAIQAIANQFPQEVSFAVGLHPLDADKWTADTSHRIAALAQSDARVVAIGEMGLDFFKATNHAHQFQVFESQLRIAYDLGLPVIIHCRDAAQPMADMMRSFWKQQGPVPGVMHCWSGTPEETEWFLDLGMHISFSGILTFMNKSAAHVKDSASCVPSDRLLIETDCPFLSPVPHRGKRPNQPAYVLHVAETLAHVRDIPLEQVAEQTTRNACTLFKLKVTP